VLRLPVIPGSLASLTETRTIAVDAIMTIPLSHDLEGFQGPGSLKPFKIIA
jgi:hypothetical protein